MADETNTAGKSGFVAIVGRPNVGKSTLLNALVGEKLSIVSDKPQTTRWRITGVLTRPEGQVVFVDTPGIHKPEYKLNRRMMAEAEEALLAVDLILLVVDGTTRFGPGDRFVVDLLKRSKVPVILVPNKIDALKEKTRLLPLISRYAQERAFDEVIPASALDGDGIELLIQKIFEYLEEGPPLYPEDYLTDQPERVLAAELVREKVLARTHEELPYVTAVVTERWEETPSITRIHCVIYVERASERPIIIGKGGALLKEIGAEARAGIERLLGRQVFLGLYVKVRQHWRDDERTLDELGIGVGTKGTKAPRR
ncbi:MAG TPA: GTPase Era [Blastocatellia bacterium]|nr:GTPase Era [Blastocatellia bacterium]